MRAGTDSKLGRTWPGFKPPGRGVLRPSPGDSLRLYDHPLEVTLDGRTAEYSLHEVPVCDEYSGKAGHLYVALPTGRQQILTVLLEETPEAEMRTFVVAVFNAAADAKVSKVERQVLVPQAGAGAELRKRDRRHRRPGAGRPAPARRKGGPPRCSGCQWTARHCDRRFRTRSRGRPWVSWR